VQKFHLFFFLFLFPLTLLSQQRTKIIVDKWLRSRIDVKNNVTYLKNPIFRQDNAILTCDSAVFYEKKNVFEAFNNVHINQADTVNIFSDHLTYDGNTKIAHLTSNVRLLDRESVLTTNILDYNMTSKIGTYVSGGKIVNKDVTLTSKNGYYFANSRDAYFRYNVVVVTPETVIKSDTLRYNTLTNWTYFYGPTNIKGKTDNLYTENGAYNTKTQYAYFGKKNLYTQGSKSLKGDSLYYDGIAGYGKAVRNIVSMDTVDKFIMHGQLGYYYKVDQRTLVTKNAYFGLGTDDSIIVAGVKQRDTLWLGADTLETQVVLRQTLKLISGPVILKDNEVGSEKPDEGDSIPKKPGATTPGKPGNAIPGKTGNATPGRANSTIPGKTPPVNGKNVVKNKGKSPPDEKPSQSSPATIAKDSLANALKQVKNKDSLLKDLTVLRNKDSLLKVLETTKIKDSLSKELSLVKNKSSKEIRKAARQKKKDLKLVTDSLAKNGVIQKKDSLVSNKVIDALAKDSTLNKIKDSVLNKRQVLKSDSTKKQSPAKKTGTASVKKDLKKPAVIINPLDTVTARSIKAYHKVNVYKSNMQAKADSLFYTSADSTLRWYYNPIMWSEGTQQTGDTIYLQLKNKKLNTVQVIEKAFTVNVYKDSLKFNQIKGKKITGFFKNGKMNSMFVDGNAESIYFTKDDDDKAYKEMNQTVSSRIKISFKDSEIQDVLTIKDPDGAITPIEKVKEEVLLTGFQWKPEMRPISKYQVTNPKAVPKVKKASKTAGKAKPGATTSAPPPVKNSTGKKNTNISEVTEQLNDAADSLGVNSDVRATIKDSALKVLPKVLKKADSLIKQSPLRKQ
jgi:lipopolysaccharide export system protein LptA